MKKAIAALVLIFAFATTAIADSAPTTLTFDQPVIQFIGVVGQTDTETITVTNNTGQNFIIESIETSGSPWSYISGDCYVQQIPGAVCQITIGFTPAVDGTIMGAVNFYSVADLWGGIVSASVPLEGNEAPELTGLVTNAPVGTPEPASLLMLMCGIGLVFATKSLRA